MANAILIQVKKNRQKKQKEHTEIKEYFEKR